MSLQIEGKPKRAKRTAKVKMEEELENGVATIEKPGTKRSHLKLFERIQIIRSHEESGYKKSVRALSKEFNLSKSAVAEILRKRDLYVEQYKAFGEEDAELSKRSYLRIGDKMRIIQGNTDKSICNLSQEFHPVESTVVTNILSKRNSCVQEQPPISYRPPVRRLHLCLDDKVQIIRAHHESGGKSVRALSEEFKVSKSAVAEILKKRHLYLRQYEVNDPDMVARRQMAQRDYLATLVWQWYQAAIAKKLTITMPLLKELAQTYGDALGMEGFDANDDWLEGFIRSRRIKQSVVEGSGEDVAFIKRWKMSLPELVGEYEAKDVFVCDETALVYSALPSKSLATEALDRWTLLLCCSAMGEKVRPFICVTGNDLCPKDLAITVHSGKHARMTPELFSEFLSNLNEDMKIQGRQVLLFADSNRSHMANHRALSNIRLELFPPEVSSFVQPLDLGVVRLFKTRYRTELLRQTAAVRRSGRESEVTTQQATWWVAGAWKMVPEDAIRRCFNEAGFPVACTEFYLTSDALDIELSQLSELFDCSKDWAGVAPHEYVTFDNTLETEIAECTTPRSSGEPEGPQMSYEDLLMTVDRLLDFAMAHEPQMISTIRELKNMAERTILKKFTGNT